MQKLMYVQTQEYVGHHQVTDPKACIQTPTLRQRAEGRRGQL